MAFWKWDDVAKIGGINEVNCNLTYWLVVRVWQNDGDSSKIVLCLDMGEMAVNMEEYISKGPEEDTLQPSNSEGMIWKRSI